MEASSAMASASSLTDVEEELQCPICMEYLSNPVSVDCGHNFCSACITKCWEKWENLQEDPRDLACPLCKAKIKKENFRPNWLLKSLVEKIKALSFKTETGAMCRKHNATLNLFCKQDKEFVCSICERSPEHRPHTILLLEEAAAEYKDQFRKFLETLENERENILAYKAATEKENQDLLAETKATREKTVAEFRRLHQFLEEEENRLLAHLEEVEEETASSKDEHLARLSSKLSSLDSLIQEIQKKQQQSANELLRDVGSILLRCENRKTFENPVAALKWRNWEISDINLSLEGVIKQCKETLVSQLHWQKENVTLDPNTAYPKLILSPDLKSVRVGEEWQDLPESPERFDTRPAVLGREEFAAGKHFWDIDIGSEEPWIVGVARKSVRRNGWFDFSPDDGIWAVGKWGGQYKVQNPPENTPLSLSQELKRIQVTLDCDQGKVAFFDADREVHLYTYAGASFCGETLLPFFFMFKKVHLTLPEPVTGTSSQAQCVSTYKS